MAIVKGKAQMKRNMNKVSEKILQAAVRGAMKGGVTIRNQGQRETPVDTANLINSWFGPVVAIASKSRGVLVTFGLTADYAVYVHEMVGARFRKPGAKAKFLEDPVKSNEARVLNDIAREIKKVT